MDKIKPTSNASLQAALPLSAVAIRQPRTAAAWLRFRRPALDGLPSSGTGLSFDAKEVLKMKKNMDTIQFESRAEVGELIKVLEKYVDAYPKDKDNPTVKNLYNLLDVMEMEW
jgi:hypothetical protein